MTKIKNMKGFSYPTPTGASSVVGDLPWHFGTEHLGIIYRTDPKSIKKFLPEPLKPGENPDLVFVEFGKWYSLWDNELDMPYINPERTVYNETVIWVGSSYKGEEGKTCIQTWVDKDFSLARGMYMGFNKRLGETYKTNYFSENPKMPELGVGSKLRGWTTSHGERLMEGTLEVTEKIEYNELPDLINKPLYNIRYFPSIEKGAPPSVCELVTLNMENFQKGDVWKGKGTFEMYSASFEEYIKLAPREIVGAYYYTNGCTITGGKVLHNWV